MSLYVTRFAPTPSGRLHLGSLIAAVGAYLRARAAGGQILLRIEDLDFPRCRPENTLAILSDLKALGFEFDGKPFIQSEHLADYESLIKSLKPYPETFYCDCTRAQLKNAPCECFKKHLTGGAFKVCLKLEKHFYDEHLGEVQVKMHDPLLTLKRRDGIIAYNLACVLDDERQGVSEVVRGADLLDITPYQIALIRLLGFRQPAYFHLPLAIGQDGHKLSKQNHAKAALEEFTPSAALLSALKFLGQDISGLSLSSEPSSILEAAISRYQPKAIPKSDQLCENAGRSLQP